MRKWPFLAIILLIQLVAMANAPTVTLNPGTVLQNKYGKVTVRNPQTYNNVTLYANGTIYFNLYGLDCPTHAFIFQAQSYGNGTLNLLFRGQFRMEASSTGASFIGQQEPVWTEKIQYSISQTSELVVTTCRITGLEPGNSVLFQDDFLYSNSLETNKWTMDYTLSTAANVYSQGGFMYFRGGSSQFQEVHVTRPAYDNSTLTAPITRQLTVSFYPFDRSTGLNTLNNVSIGFAQLIKCTVIFGVCVSPSYPGPAPFNTPCDLYLGIFLCDTPQRIGYATATFYGGTNEVWWRTINNAGSLDSAQITTSSTLLNPTFYTVLQIIWHSETSGSSNSKDWAFIRVYQLDGKNNKVLQLENNRTSTSIMPTPVRGTFSFIRYGGPVNSPTFTKVDFVDLRNSVQPITIEPGTTPGTTPPPVLPANPTAAPGFLGLMTLIASGLGGGDISFGAIVFFIIMGSLTTIPFLLLTRNIFVPSIIMIVNIGIFVYSRLLPAFLVILLLIGGAVLGVMVFREALIIRRGIGED